MKNLYIIILLFLSTSAFSQFYVKEVGVRGGYTSGFTFRINLEEALSYEAQVNYRDQGVVLAMVRLRHRELGMDQHGNWKLLYGFGAHAGFYFTDSYRILYRQVYYGRNMFTPVLGANGYLGIEYQMVDAPVSFGANFQPFMELSLKQLFGINLWDFGVSVKYRF